MSTFTFQVDRLHQANRPLTLHPDLACKGAPVAIAADEKLLYRGTVEIDHRVRYVFERDGTKLYTMDRAPLEPALTECLDELLVIRP